MFNGNYCRVTSNTHVCLKAIVAELFQRHMCLTTIVAFQTHVCVTAIVAELFQTHVYV